MKKPTDEEIAKALLQQIEYGKGIPYINEWKQVKTVKFTEILDFIHRLQSKNEKLTAFKNEAISMSLYGKGRKDGEDVAKMELEQQKSEIERLTEENRVVKHNMDFHRNEKFELQKQVDELKTVKADYLKNVIEKTEKDTAKEICKAIHEDLQATLFNLKYFITDSEGQKAQEQQNIGIIKAQDAVSKFEKTIKERYGVEVE